MKITNIQWDIDVSDAIDALLEKRTEAAAEILGIPSDQYANMTTSERVDYANDLFRRSPATMEEMYNLPNEVELPEELAKEAGTDDPYEDDITEWLSDEYGTCVSGWNFDSEIEEEKE